jgi:hypothetical protein
MLILLMAVFAKIIVLQPYIDAQLQRYGDARKQSEIVSIRELIIRAAEAVKTNAPLDPKTGDIYFPQAKLYLPNESSFLKLMYAYDDTNNTGPELSISNRNVFEQNIAKLYSAQDIKELFAGVPKLQSCQRGVTLAYSQLSSDSDRVLKDTVQLNNGKTLYLHAESTCPDLDETIELLKGVKAY